MLNNYDAVIQEQLIEGLVEPAPNEVSGTEFYLPHRAVVRESARLLNYESRMTRLLEHMIKLSLNECLYTGPPLQNKLWSVLVRNRFHPVVVAGDLRRAFLQVRVRETERDALRFHWLTDKATNEVQTLRFTRVIFGLAPPPFLLNGVIQLENLQSIYPGSVNDIRNVDDLISGGFTKDRASHLKREAVEIFADAKFTFHKWQSNERDLETDCDNDETTFAKEQLDGGSTKAECKPLGVGWDKAEDTLRL